MQYRRLGKTGRDVSAIGFGAWAIGADWGKVDDAESLRALHAAADAGVTLIDTADVYGDGRSEQVISRFLGERSGERFFVATKMGRRAPLDMAEYTPEAFRAWVDRSRDNLRVDRLDLVQLHCLPTSIYYHPETFAALDDLVAAGAIANYGVSVERVEEGLKALEYPGVASVQIIFNMLRQRPADRFLAEAKRRDVGVLARVPMASGLLTGQDDREDLLRRLGPPLVQPPRRSLRRWRDVRRRGLRRGPGLRRGTSGSGPAGATMAQMALRWILEFDGVTAAIPGAKSPEQAKGNAAAADLAAIAPATMDRIRAMYEERIKPLVHQRW